MSWDSECPYHEALKVALLVPLGDTVSALMVEPPTQSSTDASDAPSNLMPKPSRASVWMSLTLVAPFSSLNRSFCWDSECQTGKLVTNWQALITFDDPKW